MPQWALRDYPTGSLSEALTYTREHLPTRLQALVTSQLGIPWLARLAVGLE